MSSVVVSILQKNINVLYSVGEIVLVDDASEHQHLQKQLEDYVAKLPVQVKIIRSTKRIGLIKARLLGAENSKGKQAFCSSK